jgi:hypothetical protein
MGGISSAVPTAGVDPQAVKLQTTVTSKHCEQIRGRIIILHSMGKSQDS